jgi:acyl-coenzyme A synthetase/AMP-(fatty) acid ligase
VFRSEPLPKSNIGKILRRQLREVPAPAGAGSMVSTPAA